MPASSSFSPIPRQHVEPLDQRRERHRRVDVALRHVEAHAFGDQRHADHQQEAERQHDDGRIALDELRKRVGRQQHHRHRGDHRDEHDRHMRRSCRRR